MSVITDTYGRTFEIIHQDGESVLCLVSDPGGKSCYFQFSQAGLVAFIQGRSATSEPDDNERVVEAGDGLAVVFDEHGCTFSVVVDGGRVTLNTRNAGGRSASFSCSLSALEEAIAKAKHVPDYPP